MALTQAESGILHLDDHYRHQQHHDEVYDVEHHSWPVSYDILRHKIEWYKLRAEVAWRESAWHVKRSEDGASEMAVTGEPRRASQNTKAETQPAQLPKVVYYPCRGPVSGCVCYEIHCETKCSCSLLLRGLLI